MTLEQLRRDQGLLIQRIRLGTERMLRPMELMEARILASLSILQTRKQVNDAISAVNRHTETFLIDFLGTSGVDFSAVALIAARNLASEANFTGSYDLRAPTHIMGRSVAEMTQYTRLKWHDTFRAEIRLGIQYQDGAEGVRKRLTAVKGGVLARNRRVMANTVNLIYHGYANQARMDVLEAAGYPKWRYTQMTPTDGTPKDGDLFDVASGPIPPTHVGSTAFVAPPIAS